VFSLLSEDLNLELPLDACQEMEAHIAGCPPCVEFAESLRKTVDLCRQYRPTELPEFVGKNARAELLAGYRKCSAGGKHSREKCEGRLVEAPTLIPSAPTTVCILDDQAAASRARYL
jgi:hypothetical protein